VTCHFWNHSINDSYLVNAGESSFMLRVAPANWRSPEQLNAELDLLNFLNQHQLSAPQPVPQKDGTFIQAIHAPEGIRYAILFTLVPGSSPSMNATTGYRYGEAVAQLHVLTDDYPANRAGFHFDRSDMVDEPLARIEVLFSAHRNEYEYLLEIAPRLKRIAETLPRIAPTYGICHGDLNAGNFHLNDEAGWSLVDFEYFGYGWRVFDIATFFNTQLIDQGRTDDTKRILQAFLDGYQARRPLSQPELESLPDFVILRQLWLLGTSARYIPKSTVGLDIYQRWIFQGVIPFIREWMDDPW
jgi:Ser/Thr protein kinase RdoA (MazF antagonist)